MGESNFITGFQRGVYLFGTTHSDKLEPSNARKLEEISHFDRDSRLEKMVVPLNKLGKKPLLGTPIGIARAAIGLIATAIALIATPFFALAKLPLPTKTLGFGLSWTLLGIAEFVPYLGKLAHILAQPNAEYLDVNSTLLEKKLANELIAKRQIGEFLASSPEIYALLLAYTQNPDSIHSYLIP